MTTITVYPVPYLATNSVVISGIYGWNFENEGNMLVLQMETEDDNDPLPNYYFNMEQVAFFTVKTS